MSQMSDLLSDDDIHGSPGTCSDKFTDDASVSCTEQSEGPRLERQHTEVSEISETDIFPCDIHDGHSAEHLCECQDQFLLPGTSSDTPGKHGRRVHYDCDSMTIPTKCDCVNCLNEKQFLQYGQSEHLLDSEHNDHFQHSVQTEGYFIQGQMNPCLRGHYHNDHWQGISISDDEIEIIADPEYYNDHVFYVDPAVARSLLSDFLLQEERPANLHIHVDTRTKRQRFIARAVMIISMTMFTVSALLVMVSLIMSDHIDDLVRGTNTLLSKTSNKMTSLPTTASIIRNSSYTLGTTELLLDDG